MKFVSCHITGFGKFVNCSFDLSSPLSVIKNDNGWGKTTLADFLRCMLYGLDGGRLRAGLRDIRDNYTYSQFAETRPVDKPGYIPARGYPCAECPRRH